MSKRSLKTIKLSDAMQEYGLSAEDLMRLRPQRESNGAIYVRRVEVESLVASLCGRKQDRR